MHFDIGIGHQFFTCIHLVSDATIISAAIAINFVYVNKWLSPAC